MQYKNIERIVAPSCKEYIPQKFTFLYEVFNKKEYNDFKTDYMYIDREVNSLC